MHKNEISIPRSLGMGPPELLICFPSIFILPLMPLSPNELEPEAPKPNAALPFCFPSSQPKDPVPTDRKIKILFKMNLN